MKKPDKDPVRGHRKGTQKLSTDPYVGVRDFYPEDMAVQQYIFNTWSKTAESFGFARYDASSLEPSELYKSKGAENEELVNEQTYTFTDRGDREVTLRPEMTPSVARMVAGRRRELTFPLRWYAIPNLFRYERKQRGRVREHWQLNCDIFGTYAEVADIEIILLASSILKAFGAQDADFEIKINSRKLWNSLCESWKLSDIQKKELSGLVDRKNKLEKKEFEEKAEKIFVDKETLQKFLSIMNLAPGEELPRALSQNTEYEELMVIQSRLTALGVTNASYDPTIMRGFEYYTGTIFELFDTDPTNRRSLLGGGRYDNLTGLFGGDPIPAVGFGMGDVTMRDFLETHGILPAHLQHIDLAIIPQNILFANDAEKIAQTFRAQGCSVYVSLSDKKIGDHIKSAEARHTAHILVFGEHESLSQTFALKRLSDGKETAGSLEELVSEIKQ